MGGGRRAWGGCSEAKALGFGAEEGFELGFFGKFEAIGGNEESFVHAAEGVVFVGAEQQADGREAARFPASARSWSNWMEGAPEDSPDNVWRIGRSCGVWVRDSSDRVWRMAGYWRKNWRQAQRLEAPRSEMLRFFANSGTSFSP